MSAKRQKILSRIGLLTVLIATVIAFRALPVGEWLQQLESWTQDHPLAGPLVFIVLAMASVVALTPGWIPMSLAGVLFGFGWGLAYALFAMTIGAAAALIVGRTLARSWVEKRIAGNDNMLALDDALADQAFTIVVLTRIALVIPFNMLNYAYGLTRVNLPVYTAATAVGMLPIVALYAYLGSIADDIGAVLSGEAKLDLGFVWIAGIAVVVIAMVIIVVRRAVRRALSRRTQSVQDSE